MGIENIKRWQWMILGVLVGLAFAYMNQASSPGNDNWSGRKVGQATFERLAKEKPIAGNPVIRSLRLFPAQVSPATGQRVVVVEFDQLLQTKDAEVWEYVPTRFEAIEPYVPVRGPKPATDQTVEQYLAEVAKENPALASRYAWWTEPKWAYTVWGAGGFVVIGIVWPTIVNLLIGAGLGRPPAPKEEYDLSRFKGTPEPAPAPKPVVADMGSLETLNASLEKDLEAAGVLGNRSTDPDDSVAGEPVIKPLNAGPLDAPPETKTEADKPSEHFKGGVFYPVARGGPKE
jgi:hypothetical protein